MLFILCLSQPEHKVHEGLDFCFIHCYNFMQIHVMNKWGFSPSMSSHFPILKSCPFNKIQVVLNSYST